VAELIEDRHSEAHGRASQPEQDHSGQGTG
jgi:hypothetical protein